MIDVQNATTKELVAFYNEHSESPVKKFADRKTAERRVQFLIEQLPAEEENFELAMYGIEHCPHCGIHLSNGVSGNGDEVNGTPIKLDHEFECMACGGGFGKEIKRRHVDSSESIKASWKDPEIKAKRSQRSAVQVDGDQYPSVAKAFKALGLPMNEHVKFRMKLKQKIKLRAYDHVWKVIPLNYEQEDV